MRSPLPFFAGSLCFAFASLSVYAETPSAPASAVSAPAPAAAAPMPGLGCLRTLAKVEASNHRGLGIQGTPPKVIDYEKPHPPLSVWKQKSGALLVFSKEGVYSVPAPEGAVNGKTLLSDPRSDYGKTLAPSLYRQVHLPDGRSFSIHRLGQGAEAVDFVRSEAEDTLALEHEEERNTARARRAREALAHALGEFESACEEGSRRFSERSVAENFAAFVAGFQRSMEPGIRRENPAESRSGALRRAVEREQDAIAETKRRTEELARVRQELKAFAAEREKPAFQLQATALNLSGKEATALLREATQTFSERADLTKLDEGDRLELSACKDYLELPAPKVAEAPASLISQGARAALPRSLQFVQKLFDDLETKRAADKGGASASR